MNKKQSQEPAPDIKTPAMIPAEPASRDYVDAKHAEGTAFTESVKSYIVTHFFVILLSILALIFVFIWSLFSAAKQERQAIKAEAKQERREAKQERREAKQERREAKQERQAIQNTLKLLLQAQPIAKPQAKPTSL